MSRNGWIRLDRKILDNPDLKQSPERLAIWIWLLLNAAHEPETRVYNGQLVELEAGQLVTTTREISEETGVPYRATRTALKTLETRLMIGKQATTKNTVFTILNWSLYQSNPPTKRQQPANRTPTERQQPANRTPTERQPTLLNKQYNNITINKRTPKLSDIKCDHYAKEDDSAALWKLLNELPEEE